MTEATDSGFRLFFLLALIAIVAIIAILYALLSGSKNNEHPNADKIE